VVINLANSPLWEVCAATATIVKIQFEGEQFLDGVPSSLHYAVQELFHHLRWAKELHVSSFSPDLYTLLIQHYHTDDNEIRYPLPSVTTVKLVGSTIFDLGFKMETDGLWEYLLYRQSNAFLCSIEKLVVLNDGLPEANMMQLMHDFQPALIHLLKPATQALFCAIECEAGAEVDGLWAVDPESRVEPPNWHVPIERLLV
jgi:hypothetical protein